MKFLLSTLIFAGFALAALRPAETVAPSTKPNILFIIADDWGFPHASAYGDGVVKTPNFDKLAREGVLFTNAHCAAPSCSPSRAGILTGRYPHTLREGANLSGTLPKEFPVFPDLLAKAGYTIGSFSKGWGPGDVTGSGYDHNPAGPETTNYRQFFKEMPADKPFCFWLGTYDPHRPYEEGSGKKMGMDASKVRIPAYWPDRPEIRDDVLDYYVEVQRFDNMIGDAVRLLDSLGRLDNTLIMVTSDNGMPFPRAKARVYDAGTHIPLAIWWKGMAPAGRTSNEFVNLIDVAPTVLEATNTPAPSGQHGKSLVSLLKGKTTRHRAEVFVERERHTTVRPDTSGYPQRAIRTNEFLYVWNLRPDRIAAGDSVFVSAQGTYSDMDKGASKTFLLSKKSDPAIRPYFALSFGQSPAEELYDLKKDPDEVTNVAANPAYQATKKQLRNRLLAWMRETNDPRQNGKGDEFDHYPYYFRNKKQ